MAHKPAAGTRSRVLDTAAALFYEQGVRAVGMQQIVDEAGCGKNLLYREFPSKVDLFAAYLARARQERDEQAAKATRNAGKDAASQLIAVVQAVSDSVRVPHYRGCPFRFRNYLAEFADRSDAAGRIATAYLHDTRTQIDTLVDKLGVAHPNVLADRIWVIVEGLHSAAAHPGGGQAGEIAVTLVADLIDSARAALPA
jgi:AcrR family transcriptional regulator